MTHPERADSSRVAHQAASPPPDDARGPQRGRALSDDILDLIRERDLRQGQRLPTETEIARVFSVSRPKVREALRELESMGVVRSRQGSGRVLLHRRHHALSALLGRGLNHSPADILEAVLVRQVLEVGFLSAAMSIIDGEAIERMRAAVEGMRAGAARKEPFPVEDRAFHEALFAGLKNDLLNSLLDNFWDLFAGIDLDVLRHRENPEDTIRHHADIIESIERGDFANVRFHMELHFYDSVESLRDFAARQETV